MTITHHALTGGHAQRTSTVTVQVKWDGRVMAFEATLLATGDKATRLPVRWSCEMAYTALNLTLIPKRKRPLLVAALRLAIADHLGVEMEKVSGVAYARIAHWEA
jgi:hypothetical protein